MAIFGQSYAPPDDSQDLTEEQKILREKQVRFAIEARETFVMDILPKLEDKLENICKVLRWTLSISEGETTEQIMQGDEDRANKIVDTKRPLHKEVILMQNSIDKVKLILKKSKEIKDELKYDIHEQNEQIDEYLELIGKDFIIDSLFQYQKNNAMYLESQLDALKLQKENEILQFQGKIFQAEKPKSTFENVQHILDLRIDQLKKEQVSLEEQLHEYSEMKEHDSAELKKVAKEYEKYMYFKCSLEQELQKNI